MSCPEHNLDQADVASDVRTGDVRTGDVGTGNVGTVHGPAVGCRVRISAGSVSPLAFGSPTRRTNQERGSLLVDAAPILGELAPRYPEVPDETIRQQAIDVLGLAQGSRVSVALVARLVEARIIALL